MHYDLTIGDEAKEQLRSLPKPLRRKIGHRLESLQEGLARDINETRKIQ